jgi:hypothetical protein
VVQWSGANEVDIASRTFWVSPVGYWVLESGNVVAQALTVSLDKPLEWAVGFFTPVGVIPEYQSAVCGLNYLLVCIL